MIDEMRFSFGSPRLKEQRILTQGFTEQPLISRGLKTNQNARTLYKNLFAMGFRDAAYCMIPLILGFGFDLSSASKALGMSTELGMYALLSFCDGVPLNLEHGPKAFIATKARVLQGEKPRVLFHKTGYYLLLNGTKIALRVLYAGSLALKHQALRKTLDEPILAKDGSSVFVYANVGYIPPQHLIRKRFSEILNRGKTY
ncbi:hypothetical protein B9Q04_01805 [Candidatus Marsarchaeota G2 archaeon BE_D]|uniref:Uncharacterized protein n=3 Tax=Candidatus Marsarchaeota TaxID=1978152 RepID=A0A2R6CE23_9ARCH|nr:MAG: hypothetical protein B9Q01_06210 [Candidatus Marsarchaeota G1 archaeon OSP_D]PSN87811.1 MAG: hypothetical protein B9Q00_07755 [Candidatus Marsarchaeota G1 archaeon OSP_C]PSO09154.1 MAG: hypothetical protein B9Q04_01805 [Candidatus Marsarchaeota G2 archaeon BE_D]